MWTVPSRFRTVHADWVPHSATQRETNLPCQRAAWGFPFRQPVPAPGFIGIVIPARIARCHRVRRILNKHLTGSWRRFVGEPMVLTIRAPDLTLRTVRSGQRRPAIPPSRRGICPLCAQSAPAYRLAVAGWRSPGWRLGTGGGRAGGWGGCGRVRWVAALAPYPTNAARSSELSIPRTCRPCSHRLRKHIEGDWCYGHYRPAGAPLNAYALAVGGRCRPGAGARTRAVRQS
jgi:hypothetical protein